MRKKRQNLRHNKTKLTKTKEQEHRNEKKKNNINKFSAYHMRQSTKYISIIEGKIIERNRRDDLQQRY